MATASAFSLTAQFSRSSVNNYGLLPTPSHKASSSQPPTAQSKYNHSNKSSSNSTKTKCLATCKQHQQEKTMDGFFVAYGEGKLKVMLGDRELIIDAIPGDMVVDFILAVIVAHAHQLPQPLIYHIGSSRRNPLTYADLYKFGFNYFTKNPWTNASGKPVKVTRVKILRTMASFRKYFMVRLLPLVKVSKLVNMVFCRHFEDQHNKLKRSMNHVMRLAEVYESFVFFKGIFDDANTEKLLMMIKEANIDVDILSVDSKSIKWEEYFMSTHLHGVKKYLMK